MTAAKVALLLPALAASLAVSTPLRPVQRLAPARLATVRLAAGPPAYAAEAVVPGGSGKGKPATAYFKPLQAGDVLESTNEHRLICAAAATLSFALLVKAALAASAAPLTAAAVLRYVLAAVVGYEFADFGSGVYHWSMDNYGNAGTPVFGRQIEAFQGHHERPWTITHRQTCNNLHQSCIATMPPLAAWLLLVSAPSALIFGAVAMSFIILAQARPRPAAASSTPPHAASLRLSPA
jgi:ubiquitin-conjugating enzyme E2 variant